MRWRIQNNAISAIGSISTAIGFGNVLAVPVVCALSLALVFMAATAMPAMADEAVSASAEISPFAGVVDVSVLALLAYFAKLGNEKAAREAQSKTKTSRSKRK